MKREKVAILTMILMLLFALPAQAADTKATTLRLEKTEGTVKVEGKSGKAVSLIEGMKLYSGYRVGTAAKSYAYLSLDENKAVKLDASSKAEIRKSGKQIELHLISGELLCDVTAPLKKDETLNIRTSTMVTGIRGTALYLKALDNGTTEIYVLDGKVTVTARDPITGETKQVTITAGQRATSVLSSGQADGAVEIQVEPFSEDDIPGYVATEIKENEELRVQIAEGGSGLDVNLISDGAEDRLNAEWENEKKLQQKLETELKNQITNTLVPLFSNSTGGSTSQPVTTFFTVSFDSKGGSSISPISVENGHSIATLPQPSKDHSTFLGWYRDSAFTIPFTTTTAVTEPLTLYAKWQGWQEPASLDVRFADGYPKARIVDGKIELRVKLKEASQQNPAELFMTVNQNNSSTNSDVTAVLHGHAGVEGDLVSVDASSYLLINNTGEHIIQTNESVQGNKAIKIYFVLKDLTGTSETPTMLEFTKETATALDTTAPNLLSAYVNADRTKIVLHFNEALDTDSVPDSTDFSLSSETLVTNVTISNGGTQSSNKRGRVELTLASPIHPDYMSTLTISYSGTGLQDQAATPNQVAELNEKQVHVATLSPESVFVSHNGQYIYLKMEHGLYFQENTSPIITLKYGADSQSATTIDAANYSENFSYAWNGTELEYSFKLDEPPIPEAGNKYYIILNANGLCDYAGDPVANIEVPATPRESQENVVVPNSAVYSFSSNTLTLNISSNCELRCDGVFACLFTVTIDGTTYTLRGNSYYNEGMEGQNTIVFEEANMPFDPADQNWEDATISYSRSLHPTEEGYGILKFNSGLPYEGFSNLQISVP